MVRIPPNLKAMNFGHLEGVPQPDPLGDDSTITMVITLPETNSSPLQMDGWNTILSYWVSAYFQGRCRTVSLREGNHLRPSWVINQVSKSWDDPPYVASELP